MAGEWVEKTIGEAPIYIGDGNYSSKYPKSGDFVPAGVPFITASDMINGHIRSDNFRYISKRQHEELKKGHLCKGDVIVVTRGNGIGNVAFVDPEFDDANINAQLVLLRTHENELHNRFLYFLLSSKEFNEVLIRYGSGSAQPQIPINSLVKIPLRYPGYDEQRAIAHILGTLDDKIELNRRMNETLEAMARAIFKSWFVDFDPVRAKAEGRARQDGARSGQPIEPCIISEVTREAAQLVSRMHKGALCASASRPVAYAPQSSGARNPRRRSEAVHAV